MSFRTIIASSLFLATPALADMDPCLVGSWQADLDDLAHMFAVQMEANNVLANGNVDLQILPTGNATLSVRDLVLDMDKAGIPPMAVTVNGATVYDMRIVSDGVFGATTDSINLVASAEVLGSVMEIPFSSAEGLFGGGMAEYGCTASGLAVESGDPAKFPRKWTRTE